LSTAIGCLLSPFYIQFNNSGVVMFLLSCQHSRRKEYVPLSLLQLQRMIDLGRVDVNRPIDITALCNSQLIKVDRELNQYGIHLTDEVMCSISCYCCLPVARNCCFL